MIALLAVSFAALASAQQALLFTAWTAPIRFRVSGSPSDCSQWQLSGQICGGGSAQCRITNVDNDFGTGDAHFVFNVSVPGTALVQRVEIAMQRHVASASGSATAQRYVEDDDIFRDTTDLLPLQNGDWSDWNVSDTDVDLTPGDAANYDLSVRARENAEQAPIGTTLTITCVRMRVAFRLPNGATLAPTAAPVTTTTTTTTTAVIATTTTMTTTARASMMPTTTTGGATTTTTTTTTGATTTTTSIGAAAATTTTTTSAASSMLNGTVPATQNRSSADASDAVITMSPMAATWIVPVAVVGAVLLLVGVGVCAWLVRRKRHASGQPSTTFTQVAQVTPAPSTPSEYQAFSMIDDSKGTALSSAAGDYVVLNSAASATADHYVPFKV